MTAGGDITDSGVVSVAGSSILATAGGKSIVLDETGNTFNGPVTFNSTGGGNLLDVTIADTTDFDIAAVTVMHA